jgi:hypothetical protein
MAMNVARLASELDVPVATVRRIAARLAGLDGPELVLAGFDELSDFGVAGVRREWFLMCRTSTTGRVESGPRYGPRKVVFRQCDGDPGTAHRTRMVDSDLMGASPWVVCDGACEVPDDE